MREIEAITKVNEVDAVGGQILDRRVVTAFSADHIDAAGAGQNVVATATIENIIALRAGQHVVAVIAILFQGSSSNVAAVFGARGKTCPAPPMGRWRFDWRKKIASPSHLFSHDIQDG
ncbi:hypothetical protein ABC347_13710 [Sphingomonas sp. 1P06PA]